MDELDDRLKRLIKEYVSELLEAQGASTPVLEVFDLRQPVRATRADDGSPLFVDVAPGRYVVVDVGTNAPGEEVVWLVRDDGLSSPLPPLVSKTHVGDTALGRALFDR